MTGFDDFQRKFVRPQKGRALVVGSKCYGNKLDRRKLYADAIGVDQFAGEGVDIVADMEQPQDLGRFAHVDCCSVLEHVQRPWKMAETIDRALEPGGSILILAPFAWRIHAYPDDYWRLTPSALDVLFPNVVWTAKRFILEDRMCTLIPRLKPGKWLARSEIAGFGYKCT